MGLFSLFFNLHTHSHKHTHTLMHAHTHTKVQAPSEQANSCRKKVKGRPQDWYKRTKKSMSACVWVTHTTTSTSVGCFLFIYTFIIPRAGHLNHTTAQYTLTKPAISAHAHTRRKQLHQTTSGAHFLDAWTMGEELTLECFRSSRTLGCGDSVLFTSGVSASGMTQDDEIFLMFTKISLFS